MDEGFIQAGFGVYNGAIELRDGPVRVLPLRQFFKALTQGGIFA